LKFFGLSKLLISNLEHEYLSVRELQQHLPFSYAIANLSVDPTRQEATVVYGSSDNAWAAATELQGKQIGSKVVMVFFLL